MFRRLSRRLGDDDMHMTWKVRDKPVPALALTIRDGNRTFEFLLEGRKPTQMTVYAGHGTHVDDSAWAAFRHRLALMNVEVDDTISAISESDGFTAGAGETIRDLEGFS
jgi:hypothetical protein